MKKILFTLIAFCMLHFAQAQQTRNITFIHAGKSIYGSFDHPNGSGPFPTIIITPGSGALDRNGTIQVSGPNAVCLYPNLLNSTIHMYRDLSDALVAEGYAVLRCDKIEYTYQTLQALGPISFHKFWLQTETAIDFAKTLPEVDPQNIILIGHSDGSSIIPYIAKKRNDVKALISIAGARTPFDSLLAHQVVNFTQLCSGNVSAAQAQATDILNYFNTVRTKTWTTSTPSLGSIPPAVWSDYIDMIDSVAINYNQANLPTLFTGLQLDLNVPIKELHRFQKDTNIGADFYQIPNAIHYMSTDTNPKVSEVLTDTIIYWLGQRVMTGVKKDKLDENLVQVYPNPFTDAFSVAFSGQAAKNMRLTVQNIVGQQVREEKFRNVPAGFRKEISLQNLPAGVYLIKVEADGKFLTRKMVKAQ